MQALGRPIFKKSAHDVWIVVALCVQVALLVGLALALPPQRPWLSMLVFAVSTSLGTLWNANTLAHIHLHSGIFRSRHANRAFSLLLSVVTSIPQQIWQDRHLRHHAGEPVEWESMLDRRACALECLAIGAAWVVLGSVCSVFVLTGYLTGTLVSLGLCQLQGMGEHWQAGEFVRAGVSYRGRLYNVLWFNDGFHAEHHRWPGRHWTKLRSSPLPGNGCSRFPPQVRRLLGTLDTPLAHRS